jgi:hypothetical protein
MRLATKWGLETGRHVNGDKATLSGLIRLLPQSNPLGQVYVALVPRAPFPPGAVIWVRVRTVGLKGVMSAWSDPAKLMVV